MPFLLKAGVYRAIADYTEAIRLDPKNAVAYSNRGVALKCKGKIDEAIADFNRSIRARTQNTPSLYRPRHAWSAKREYAGRSFADHTKAIGLDPKLAPAYIQPGTTRTKGRTTRRLPITPR